MSDACDFLDASPDARVAFIEKRLFAALAPESVAGSAGD